MAAPPGKKGDALVVDIELGAPKRKPKAPGGKTDPLGLGDDDMGADDVQGEMLAKRVLRAFDAADPMALNKALKAHYQHCRDAGDEEEEPPSRPGGLFGSGLGEEAEY